ncbi:ornithine carbamoyltransferase, partial [mine drainage metagenome]
MNFLDFDSFDGDQIKEILEMAKKEDANLLRGKGVALIFEKPSLRTRNSAEMATVALGGHPVYIQAAEVGIDVRESAEDIARTLIGY